MANAAKNVGKNTSSKKTATHKTSPAKSPAVKSDKDAKKAKAAKPKFAVNDLVTLKVKDGQKSPGEAPVVNLFIGDGVSGPLGKQMYRVGRDPFYNSYEESQLVLVKAGKKQAKAFRVGDKVVDRAVPTIPLRGRVMEVQGDMAYVGSKKASIAYPTRDLIPFHSKEARDLGVAYEIRRAFAVAHNQLNTVGVARAISPKERFGFVERIDGDTVTVRISDAIEKEIEISKLVLFSQPKVKPKFIVNDVVLHPAHGTGVICGTTKTEGVFEVNFEVETGIDASDLFGIEIHQDELTLVMSAKKAFEVRRERIKQEERAGRVAGKKAAELKQKLRFEDIGIFGGFVVKNRTFVKVSKSNGIPVVINGSADEPFAMLATSTTKIAPSSIQRFKKSDRVLPYAGVTITQDRAPLPVDVVGTSGPGGVHSGALAQTSCIKQ